MELILILFLPSIFGLKLFMNFNKNKTKFDLIVYYFLLVLFSNFLAMLLLILLNCGGYKLSDYVTVNIACSVRYITIMLILNLFLSILFSIMSKYFTFVIEVENEEKSKKQKNSKSS